MLALCIQAFVFSLCSVPALVYVCVLHRLDILLEYLFRRALYYNETVIQLIAIGIDISNTN